MQNRQPQDVYGCIFAQLVAWQTRFLLQRDETNEVLGGTAVLPIMAKRCPGREAVDVM
ncbi:MAG: hypothetical protein ACYSW4_08030 [Planctomycetota bacterium]